MVIVDNFRFCFAYHFAMGGERSSTTRMRLAGKICCLCGRHLDAMLWQPLGECVCNSCEAKRSPTPKLHRIHYVESGQLASIFCWLAAAYLA
jgi:hypothetical protein